ncbi:hypothetical protein STEG23_031062 [Scotinomys teguina]
MGESQLLSEKLLTIDGNYTTLITQLASEQNVRNFRGLSLQGDIHDTTVFSQDSEITMEQRGEKILISKVYDYSETILWTQKGRGIYQLKSIMTTYTVPAQGQDRQNCSMEEEEVYDPTPTKAVFEVYALTRNHVEAIFLEIIKSKYFGSEIVIADTQFRNRDIENFYDNPYLHANPWPPKIIIT